MYIYISLSLSHLAFAFYTLQISSRAYAVSLLPASSSSSPLHYDGRALKSVTTAPSPAIREVYASARDLMVLHSAASITRA